MDTDYGIPAPDHRLPSATDVGRVHLEVADLDRSLRYYTHVLGMRVLEQDESRATLGPDGPPHPLVELHENAEVGPASPNGRLGLFHFALLLPDRKALGSFIRHLADIGEAAGAANHLVSEALYLRDPDGLGIEVYADRPKSEWEHRDGQLVMATLPLDREAVARAAGDTPWEGLPAGSTMGHIHLHVGDLPEAEAFYHRALGLDKTVWSYPGALFLSAGGYHHHLGLNTWAGDVPAAGADDARLLSWTLVLPDEAGLERAAASLEAAGHGVTRSTGRVLVRDPWGTTLEIVQGRTR